MSISIFAAAPPTLPSTMMALDIWCNSSTSSFSGFVYALLLASVSGGGSCPLGRMRIWGSRLLRRGLLGLDLYSAGTNPSRRNPPRDPASKSLKG